MVRKAIELTQISFRQAEPGDLAAIIGLLADDVLGQSRERVSDPIDPAYVSAFAAMQADHNQHLILAMDENRIVGCMQISLIPGLSRLGMWRGQIESVRIAANARGGGLGQVMFEWAIGFCREKGCGLVQLTTDKARPDALRFYEKLGFAASHEGMKLALDS